MSTITLRAYMALLESVNDRNKVIEHAMGNLHSFRGHPQHLALSAVSSRTVQDMLDEARKAVGQEFTGYKDGEHVMDLHTEIHFAFYGSMDEHPEWFPNFVDALFA
jgi:hypothetical protein